MDCCKPDSLYHVFSQVIRLHYHRAHTLLEKVGVYPGQPAMLIALHIKDGQSQKDLADKLQIKPATITVMLRRMEKSGLVKRMQDTEDQRVLRVYITDKGKELFMEVTGIINEINIECFSDFTAEEQTLLKKFFIQMRDNLTQVCDKK